MYARKSFSTPSNHDSDMTSPRITLDNPPGAPRKLRKKSLLLDMDQDATDTSSRPATERWGKWLRTYLCGRPDASDGDDSDAAREPDRLSAAHDANARRRSSTRAHRPANPTNNPAAGSNHATCAGALATPNHAPSLDRDAAALIHSLNSARRLEGRAPLEIHPALTAEAGHFARMLSRPHISDPSDLSPGAAAHRMDTHTAPHHGQPTTTLERLDAGRKLRIVGPPGWGALACGEAWAGGKGRGHVFGVAPGAAHAAG
ncbi:hypothetical protein LTR53_017292, partial [Teratosphaeriaceae sp. CCFEE 6253]